MMETRLKPFVGLLLVLLAYLMIAGYTGWRLPLSVGPDEAAHFMFARFLSKEGYLPLSPEDRTAAGYKSDQPPLNAALVALTFWDDVQSPPFVKMANGVPRRHLARDGVVDQFGVHRIWDVVNTEDPPAGEVLFWHWGRLWSMVVGAWMLVVVYFLARKTFEHHPERDGWALAAVAGIAFVPTFIFTSSVFTYENLLGLWLALFLLTAVYLIKGAESGWLYGLAGLLVGLAIVTKLAALPAILSLLVLPLAAGYRANWPIRRYLARLGLSLLGLVCGAGWWVALIELRLNKVQELGWLAGILQPLIVGDGSGEGTSARAVDLLSSGATSGLQAIPWASFTEWAWYTFNTFWLSPNKEPGGELVFFYLLSGLILLGLMWAWLQNRAERVWLAFVGLFAGLFFVLPLLRLVFAGKPGVAGQGHHVLLPAIGAWAILITWGLGQWRGERKRGWLGGILLGIILLGWNFINVTTYPFPTPVPVKTVPPILPPVALEANLEFENVTLAGYQLPVQIDGPVLPVSLYWLARQAAVEDYRLALTLTNAAGQPQSAWLGYSADGRYPSRAWEKGDIIRDDLALPLTGLTAGTYTATLSLLAGGGPLPAGDGRTTFDLGRVMVASPPVAKGVQVWHAGRPVSAGAGFDNHAAIVVTAPPGLAVTLLGPDNIAHQPDTEAGAVRVFLVNPLWPRGEYRVQAGDASSAVTLTITGQSRRSQLPPPPIEVQANFAGYIKLLGYELPQKSVTAGADIPLIIQWQALQTSPADFMMFARVRDEQGRPWGGRDRWPRESYSPLLWAAGEVLEDGFSVRVAPDAPPGLYFVDVGFYLMVGEAPVSLPLLENGQMGQTTSVSLGPIQVNAP